MTFNNWMSPNNENYFVFVGSPEQHLLAKIPHIIIDTKFLLPFITHCCCCLNSQEICVIFLTDFSSPIFFVCMRNPIEAIRMPINRLDCKSEKDNHPSHISLTNIACMNNNIVWTSSLKWRFFFLRFILFFEKLTK